MLGTRARATFLTLVSITEHRLGRSSFSRIQVAALKAGQLPEPGQIVDVNSALADREQFRSRSSRRDPIDVDGGQPQRIGEDELGQRALELGFCRLRRSNAAARPVP